MSWQMGMPHVPRAPHADCPPSVLACTLNVDLRWTARAAQHSVLDMTASHWGDWEREACNKKSMK